MHFNSHDSWFTELNLYDSLCAHLLGEPDSASAADIIKALIHVTAESYAGKIILWDQKTAEDLVSEIDWNRLKPNAGSKFMLAFEADSVTFISRIQSGFLEFDLDSLQVTDGYLEGISEREFDVRFGKYRSRKSEEIFFDPVTGSVHELADKIDFLFAQVDTDFRFKDRIYSFSTF